MSSIDSSTLSGSTGLDVGATVDQLMQVERAPEQLWKVQQQTLSAQASALRDLNARLETMETRVNTLKDISGVFGQMTAESSNESVLTATADSSAASGDHVISVTQLATTASQYSEPAATSSAATFTAGSLQIRVGSGPVQTISLDQAHATLSKAADYINAGNYGVSASLLQDATGTRLVLLSKTFGSAGDLTVVGAPEGLGFKAGTVGQNAKLTIDGVPIESSTNEVSDAIPGVKLELNGNVSGTEVRLKVGQDVAGAQQAIKNFASAYNDIVSQINSQFQYNSVTKSSGILAGDGTVRNLQASLLSLGSFQGPEGSKYQTLRSLGLEMQDDGTLKVNDSALSTALQGNAEAVESFFRNDTNTGFAQSLGSKLITMTDSVNGSLVLDAKGCDDSYKSLGRQIDSFEVRMLVREQQLTDEYTRIDVMLRQMTSLETQISKQLESLE
jgi:flagellar hook-associated protein 2